MALVSLIVPNVPGAPPLDAARRSLEARGHAVDVVTPDLGEFGLASAAVDGLRQGRGDYLLILHPEAGFDPDDLAAVLDPLIVGTAELAVASRPHWRTPPLGLVGALVRPLLGTRDPLSGLIGLSREAFEEVDATLAPTGSSYTLELLVRSDARRIDVPVGPVSPTRRTRLGLGEVRHVKRLADARYGNASRLVQFCLVGASGMVVDLSCYALFQWILARTPLASRAAPLIGGPLSLAVAGALAIGLALVWNFSLNRRMTFSYARRGSLVRQFLTYALGNALGIALSFTLRLTLPLHLGFFQRHRLAAAVVGIVAATGVSFSMSRWVVFRHRSPDRRSRSVPPVCVEPSRVR